MSQEIEEGTMSENQENLEEVQTNENGIPENAAEISPTSLEPPAEILDLTEINYADKYGHLSSIWDDVTELDLITDPVLLGFSEEFINDIIFGLFEFNSLVEMFYGAGAYKDITGIYEVVGHELSRQYFQDIRRYATLGTVFKAYDQQFLADPSKRQEWLKFYHSSLRRNTRRYAGG